MHTTFRFSLLLAAGVAALPAQTPQFVGFSYNGQVSAVTRGAFGAGAGEVIAVIKGEDYAGWGTDVPGTRTITSIFYVIQDQNYATAETLTIKLYPESATNPDLPDFAAGVVFATGVTGPGAPASGSVSAAVKVVTPAVPVSVPIVGSGDVFVSFSLPANAGWTAGTDGLSIDVQLGYQPNAQFTVYDVPGATQQPTATVTLGNTHLHSYVTATQQYYLLRSSCLLMDVAHNGPAGTVLGITNQASLTGSANPPPTGYGPAPGTGDFMSGVSPDVRGLNFGRADNIAFDYYRGTAAAGSLVLFFGDVGSFGTEIPLGALFPGSLGTVCMSPSFLQLGSAIADPTGEAFFVIVFPTPLRSQVAGLAIVQQALEFDVAGGGIFRLSPCGRQQL